MTQHFITDVDGRLELNGELLIVQYQEGDYDTISANNTDIELLKRALYDECEMSDNISHDDEFVLPNGTIVLINED